MGKTIAKKIVVLMIVSFFKISTLIHAGTGDGLSNDSSLGTVVNKTGQTYNITGGTTYDDNLFHSFSEFNVETGETANFVGNTNLTNIISRVTGVNDSWINGVLKTTNTNANLILLNPNGLIFGTNASLDIQGSFYPSTADYVSFGDGGKFYSDLGESSVLTSAPVEAFGFLGPSYGSITFIDGSNLSVNQGEEIKPVAGEVLFKPAVDVDVSVDVSHIATSGLDVYLINPSNQEVLLFSGISSTGGFNNITLDDEASSPINSGSNPDPLSGSYIPENPLSEFDNYDPNGDWTLKITDSDGSGSLDGWSLTLNGTSQPPSTDVGQTIWSSEPVESSLSVSSFPYSSSNPENINDVTVSTPGEVQLTTSDDYDDYYDYHDENYDDYHERNSESSTPTSSTYTNDPSLLISGKQSNITSILSQDEVTLPDFNFELATKQDLLKLRTIPCVKGGSSLIIKGRDAVPTAFDDFLSGLPTIFSDQDFFKEDGNPNRKGYVGHEVFGEGVEDKEDKECKDCK